MHICIYIYVMESLTTHRQPNTHINNNADSTRAEPQTLARPDSSGDTEVTCHVHIPGIALSPWINTPGALFHGLYYSTSLPPSLYWATFGTESPSGWLWAAQRERGGNNAAHCCCCTPLRNGLQVCRSDWLSINQIVFTVLLFLPFLLFTLTS